MDEWIGAPVSDPAGKVVGFLPRRMRRPAIRSADCLNPQRVDGRDVLKGTEAVRFSGVLRVGTTRGPGNGIGARVCDPQRLESPRVVLRLTGPRSEKNAVRLSWMMRWLKRRECRAPLSAKEILSSKVVTKL